MSARYEVLLANRAFYQTLRVTASTPEEAGEVALADPEVPETEAIEKEAAKAIGEEWVGPYEVHKIKEVDDDGETSVELVDSGHN